MLCLVDPSDRQLTLFERAHQLECGVLAVFPPLGYCWCLWVFDQATGLHRGSDVGTDSASEYRRRALAIPHGLPEGQHQLQSHCLCILLEICCYRHVPPLPFWCTGPLDSEPGRYLSAARVAVPCLHRSPEFLAVPLALPGLVFGVGKLCKAKLYEYPRRKPKAVGRSWLSVGRRGENSGERCWARCSTGSGRRAASATSAAGTLTMGVWMSAIGIASRPPCRLRLGTRLNPKGQSPVVAFAANRPSLTAFADQTVFAVPACAADVSGYFSKAAKRGLGHGVSRERGRAQRGLDLYLRHIGTQDKNRS